MEVEEEEDAGVGVGVVVVVVVAAEEGSLTCSSKARSARQMFRSSPVQFESTSAAVWERLVFLDPSNWRTGLIPPSRDSSFFEGVDGGN